VIPGIVSTSAVRGNGEARIKDTDLATKLGYADPTKIRQHIKRNAEALKAMGSFAQIVRTFVSGNGARREVTEYHLNQAQAAYLISKARTKNATSMAIVIAEVFALFAQGHLAPTSRTAAEALRGSMQRHAERIGVDPIEERQARSEALKFIGKGRRRRK
jgi:hypothetical protein